MVLVKAILYLLGMVGIFAVIITIVPIFWVVFIALYPWLMVLVFIGWIIFVRR